MSSRSRAIRLQTGVLAVAAFASLLSGCGGDSKPDAGEASEVEVSGEPLSTYEPCLVEEHVGTFTIDLADDYTSVGGKVQDGIVPGTLSQELAREGSCRLVAPIQFSCEPDCPASSWCNMDLTCVPLPQGRDVGTVTIRGLSAAVAMTPSGTTKNYSKAPPVPHPGFQPGADIALITSGGEYEPITLRGWGVSRIELLEPVRVDPGAATALSWAVPADPGPSHVAVRLEINLHGSNPGAIECDFPDTGSGEIPASLIDGLIARGVTGFPSIIVTRRTVSSAQIEPGCVEFVVQSEVKLDVSVAGLVSCNEQDGLTCPDGLTCVPVEMRCE